MRASGLRTPTSNLRVLSRSLHSVVCNSFSCERCDDTIGVYEPLVLCDGEGTRTTSRAAEPDLRADAGCHYHRECYAAWEADEESAQVATLEG